jgi:hypothetical protein
MRNPANLAAEDTQQLDATLAGCPELSALRGHVRDFAQMMLQRRCRHLEEWTAAACTDDLSDLHSFVTGLRRDLDAVTAGLTLPHVPEPVFTCRRHGGHHNRHERHLALTSTRPNRGAMKSLDGLINEYRPAA